MTVPFEYIPELAEIEVLATYVPDNTGLYKTVVTKAVVVICAENADKDCVPEVSVAVTKTLA